jgi:hypothetical protein
VSFLKYDDSVLLILYFTRSTKFQKQKIRISHDNMRKASKVSENSSKPKKAGQKSKAKQQNRFRKYFINETPKGKDIHLNIVTDPIGM